MLFYFLVRTVAPSVPSYKVMHTSHMRGGESYTIAYAEGERRGALRREDSIPPTGKVKDAHEEVEVYKKYNESEDNTSDGPIR